MDIKVDNVSSVRDHYNYLLGPIYSWIVGDFETAYKRSVKLFARLDIKPRQGGAAIDLGCGSGCQALALMDAGFQVTAIDFCDELLAELRRRAGSHHLVIINDDILNFGNHLIDAPELIVCMGDTLVHLPDERSAADLLARVAGKLAAGGTFIVTLRDYSGPALCGPDRFIPVRSGPDRIFTCFLEYGENTIDVHDILYTRHVDEWQLQVSRYTKLRLDYKDVMDALRRKGLRVELASDHFGMKVIRALKPA
jgi:hypothetical protein